jgi:hypothetical protein
MRRLVLLIGVAALCCWSSAGAAADTGPVPPRALLADYLEKTRTPKDSKLDGLVTVYDGDFWLQCLSKRSSRFWRCESAGLEGQEWLRHSLTADRQRALMARGFKPDPKTGNFVARIPRSTAPDDVAEEIVAVMTNVYGATESDLLVKTDWIVARRCPIRIKAGAEFGGAILAKGVGFRQDAVSDCDMESNADILNDERPTEIMPVSPPGGPIDIVGRYAEPIASELKRLETTKGDHIYAIFEAGVAYVQCMYDQEDASMYCEAASDDAVGRPIARILTPERRRKLQEAGFEQPGRVMNFWRYYPTAQFEPTAIAKALLGVLRDAYGYEGAPAIEVETETGKRRPL